MSHRPKDPFDRKARQASRTLGWIITADILRAMWEHQRGLCGLTGQPMDLDDASLDHIVPRSRGGTSWLANLRWTTKAANRAKSDLLDEEFVALCAQVLQYATATADT